MEYKFRTDEEIEQEVKEFRENEKKRYEAHCRYIEEYDKDDWGFNGRDLQVFRTVRDAKPFWNELSVMNEKNKQDLISLLCLEGPVYNCSKGHTRRNYDLARLIRYSMSPAQRKVCYKILSDDKKQFR